MSRPFLRNAWYMAAWSKELDAPLLARTLLGTPIVLYRTSQGEVAALHDRCPHRFAPLSSGERRGDTLRCRYHGLSFDAKGRCVHSPQSAHVPAASQVAHWPACEQDQIVWVWPGDPALADRQAIPRFSYHERKDYRFVQGLTEVAAHYELITDNLMDLSHATFLHPAFGGEDWVPQQSLDQRGDTVHARYTIPDFPMPAFFAEMVPQGTWPRIDEHDDMRWDAPATMYLWSAFGAPGTPPTDMFVVPSAHILTPLDGHHTHYFWASGVPHDSTMSDACHLAYLRQAFEEEDMPMLELVQQRMGTDDLTALRPVLLPADAAAMRVRRLLQQRIQKEQQPPASRP